jgi:hypothetical protein
MTAPKPATTTTGVLPERALLLHVRFGALAIFMLGAVAFLFPVTHGDNQSDPVPLVVCLIAAALLVFLAYRGSLLAFVTAFVLFGGDTVALIFSADSHGLPLRFLLLLSLRLCGLSALLLIYPTAATLEVKQERLRSARARASRLHPPSANAPLPPLPASQCDTRITVASIFLVLLGALLLQMSVSALVSSDIPQRAEGIIPLCMAVASIILGIFTYRRQARAPLLGAGIWAVQSIIMVRVFTTNDDDMGMLSLLSFAVIVGIAITTVVVATRGWLALRELAQTPPPFDEPA